MASPLVIVNGPVSWETAMNGGAHATMGCALQLIMLSVGGGRAPDLDKCTLGNLAKYSYCIAGNEDESPFVPYHVDHGYGVEDTTVFTIAAEAPHSVTDHQCNDPEGILDTIGSTISMIAPNTSVLSGHCAAALDLEHAKTIAGAGWTWADIRIYLNLHSGNRFEAHSQWNRSSTVYNWNLLKWFKKEPNL